MVTDEFDKFIGEVLRVAPGVGDFLSAMDDDRDLPTVWMGHIGQAISDNLMSLDPAAQQELMATVERHLARGSELMQTCVTTGLLEAIASEVSGGRLDGPHLATLLGPESRAYIDAWDQFTLGRSSLEPS